MRTLLDNRIKAALRRPLKTVVYDTSEGGRGTVIDPSEEVLTWLKVAAFCGSQKTSELLAYQFEDGTTISGFMLSEYDRLNGKKYPSLANFTLEEFKIIKRYLHQHSQFTAVDERNYKKYLFTVEETSLIKQIAEPVDKERRRSVMTQRNLGQFLNQINKGDSKALSQFTQSEFRIIKAKLPSGFSSVNEANYQQYDFTPDAIKIIKDVAVELDSSVQYPRIKSGKIGQMVNKLSSTPSLQSDQYAMQAILKNSEILCHKPKEMLETFKLSSEEKIKETTVFSFIQSFFIWLLGGKNGNKGIIFGGEGCTEESLLDPLKEKLCDYNKNVLEPARTLREKSLASSTRSDHHPLQELFSKEARSARFIDVFSQHQVESKVPHSSEQKPQGHVEIELNLSTLNAVAQQQVQAVNQSQTLDIANELAPVQKTDVMQQVKIDSSALNTSEKVRADLESTMNSCKFFNGLFIGVDRFQLHKSNNKFDIFVSHTALEMLKKMDGLFFRTHEGVDANKLPLGFFITEENVLGTTQYSLKFSLAYRTEQLKDPKLVDMRLDPLVNEQVIKKYRRSGDTKNTEDIINLDIINLLKKTRAQFKITAIQEGFLRELLQKNRYHTAIIIRFLNDLIPIKTISDEKFGEFLDILMRFDHLPDDTFLNDFALMYLENAVDPASFFSDQSWEYLRKLAQEDDMDVLNIFNDVSSYTFSDQSVDGRLKYGVFHDHFAKTARRVYTFFNFLKDFNIKYPKLRFTSDKNDAKNASGDSLENIMNCLASIKQNHPQLLAYVAQHCFPALSDSFSHKLLSSGYSFVHPSMDLEVWEKPFEDCNIDKEEQIFFTSKSFKLIENAPIDTKRAALLRYLASQVDDAAVVGYLNYWEKNFGPISELIDGGSEKKRVAAAWPEMLAHALRLPSRIKKMESQQETSKLQTKYSQHIEFFIKKIERTTSSESGNPINWADITMTLKTMDNFIDEYAQMSSQELSSAALSCRDAQFDRARALCIIRELYFRITYNASPNHAKQGVWLRLEQITAILLASQYDTCMQIDTSEGKTFIIGATALLRVLENKQRLKDKHSSVPVITHSKEFSEDGAAKLSKIASYFDVKVAAKTNPSQEVAKDIEILYIDVFTDVLTFLLDEARGEIKEAHEFGLSDEFDTIALDIQANTVMQIAEKTQELSPELIAWVQELNLCVRQHSQNSEMKQKLQASFPANSNEKTFNFWLKAAELAAKYEPKEDYVVQTDKHDTNYKAVYIVHKRTTGSVDTDSKWSDGIHSCVAIWEKYRTSSPVNMVIPGLSKIIGKSDVASHYRNRYKHMSSFTGTFGSNSSLQQIKKIGKAAHVLIFPRAKRLELSDEHWPLALTETGSGYKMETRYSRSYRMPPRTMLNSAAQHEEALRLIKAMQKRHIPGLVFWSTINECEAFAKFLQNKGISDCNIQIYDGARDELSAENKMRPALATIIERAKQPGMVTIGTDIAGRAVDFRGENQYALLMKPTLKRAAEQRKGRVGRDGDLGIVYEIYSESDLIKAGSEQNASFFGRANIDATEEKFEDNLLDDTGKGKPSASG